MLFLRFWRLNLPNVDDLKWSLRIGDVVSNRHDRLPELGKYNAGQKMVFWTQSFFITVMFLSGLVIWDQYFGPYTLIDQKRVALLAHSLAAILAITVIFVHVYAGIWIKGTGRAMMRGNVTGGWGLSSSSQMAAQARGRAWDRDGSRNLRRAPRARGNEAG